MMLMMIKMVTIQGLTNESNKVTQAACIRDVVQETALLELLIFHMPFCTDLLV